MERFEAIYQRAVDSAGGEKALQARLPKFKSKRALAATKDDRWLAEMTRCIFQAGFVWRVVNNKWDDFEDVFFGFPPKKIVMLSPEQIDRFSQNPRIIRNRQKVLAIQHNAHFILDTASEHGSFGRFVADWPVGEEHRLFQHLKARGSRLGGMTGQRVLRTMGKDVYLHTPDVIACLIRAGVDIKPTVTSQREYRLINSAFLNWQEESGLPLSHLSRIASMSI